MRLLLCKFRVKHADGKLRWLAGKDSRRQGTWRRQVLRGAYYDIGERKQLEARLLALNETLEARVHDLRDEARTLEILNRTGIAIAGELDLERLVQTITDAGVELSGAEFGAFFYNVVRPDGEAYVLYTLSGASREDFAGFPMPRNTGVFEPTFRGIGPSGPRISLQTPLWQQSALPRYAARTPAGTQLSRCAGHIAWRCGSRWVVFRSRAAGHLLRAGRTDPARFGGTSCGRDR